MDYKLFHFNGLSEQNCQKSIKNTAFTLDDPLKEKSSVVSLEKNHENIPFFWPCKLR